MVVAVAVVILFGVMWTHYRHARKEAGNGDEILNDINNRGAKLRSQLQQDAAVLAVQQRRTAVAGNVATGPSLPADIDETKIADLIEACRFFHEPVTVDIPRQFSTNSHLESQNPLSVAYRLHLIAYETSGSFGSNTTNVKVAPLAYSEVDVSEADSNVYHFGLGRRRVVIERTAVLGESDLNVKFRWLFEHQRAAALLPQREQQDGVASLKRTAGRWTITSVSRKNGGNLPCS
ncbi:MAG TPA: hypothetical protein VLU46_04630 [Thermoanaerobaculia bacterium]|nr:hypothetical protein [Thermoanaerobaculia bacterium]